jgi:hypothetical protein
LLLVQYSDIVIIFESIVVHFQSNIDRRKRASIINIQEAKERRSSQIYFTMKEMRDKILKLAEKDKPQLEEAWQEQGKFVNNGESLFGVSFNVS